MRERDDWWLALRHHWTVGAFFLSNVVLIALFWEHFHWLQKCGFVAVLVLMLVMQASLLGARVNVIRNQRELDALYAKQEGLRSLARSIGVNYDSIAVREVQGADGEK